MNVSWTEHPAKKRKKELFLVSIFLFVLYYTVYDITGKIYLGIAVLFTILPLSGFFFKTSYIIDDNGIKIKHFYTKYRKWKEFRGIEVGKNGIFLRTMIKENFVDNYRGLFIQLTIENKNEIINFIKEKINDREKK